MMNLLAPLFLSIATTLPLPTEATTPSPEAHPFLSQKKNTAYATLSPAEQKAYVKARREALQDPAVQSTREIVHMAIHKAMLQADPSIEAILANMNAKTPKALLEEGHKKEHMGTHFQEWLADIPPQVQKTITPQERQQLKAAHKKAMQNPHVLAAQKTANTTFCNAMINANHLIGPVLKKMGMTVPTGMPGLGSEEKILGGNFTSWSSEILAPTITNLSQDERLQLQAAHDKIKHDPKVVAARTARDNATSLLDQSTAEENFKHVTREAMLQADPSIKPLLEKLKKGAPALPTTTPAPAPAEKE